LPSLRCSRGIRIPETVSEHIPKSNRELFGFSNHERGFFSQNTNIYSGYDQIPPTADHRSSLKVPPGPLPAANGISLHITYIKGFRLPTPSIEPLFFTNSEFSAHFAGSFGAM
jgi:hypothetical protein